jgi:hypothetical protein
MGELKDIKSHGMPWDLHWKIYHLMSGGMESVEDLQAATGWSLTKQMADVAFERCENARRWAHALGSPVWCGYCGTTTIMVPCPACQIAGRGNNFKTPPIRAYHPLDEPEGESQ